MTYSFTVFLVFVLFMSVSLFSEKWQKEAEYKHYECKEKAKKTNKFAKYMYGHCYVKVGPSAWLKLDEYMRIKRI